MEVRLEPARCDRPSRRLAVLACICVARRSAGPARISDGPLSQVGALLARHAFAVGRALQRAPRAIGCFVILIGATLLVASIMHVIERHAQPEKFGTIPDAMWWAIVTLGTIGYGDVVPVTALGRIVASITI